MTPRRPSATLVVDSNILLSALRGRKTLGYLDRISGHRDLCTTVEAQAEVLRVLDRIDPDGVSREAALRVFARFPIAGADEYEALTPRAARVLSHAPASANGSIRDAHILALAFALDADIWSHDRDFAGTGWPSWSSANLIAALADA